MVHSSGSSLSTGHNPMVAEQLPFSSYMFELFDRSDKDARPDKRGIADGMAIAEVPAVMQRWV